MTMSHKEALKKADHVLATRKHNGSLKDIEDAIRAYLEARGLVMVPREPTPEMARAGIMARMNVIGGYGGPSPWSAMIAAAPDPFGGE